MLLNSVCHGRCVGSRSPSETRKIHATMSTHRVHDRVARKREGVRVLRDVHGVAADGADYDDPTGIAQVVSQMTRLISLSRNS